MPVETLTQNQKNYILMLLMGGELPENEIRMFLARSAWPIDAIDAGVLYSKDEDLKRTLNEARGIAAGGSVSSTTPQVSVTAPDTNLAQPKSGDPYRETAETVAQDFSLSASTKTQTSMSTPSGLDGIKQPLKTISESQIAGSNPMIMTMPPIPKESGGKKILTIIAWFLFILFILGASAVLGYMYYTGTGFFGDVIYTRLNLNA